MWNHANPQALSEYPKVLYQIFFTHKLSTLPIRVPSLSSSPQKNLNVPHPSNLGGVDILGNVSEIVREVDVGGYGIVFLGAILQLGESFKYQETPISTMLYPESTRSTKLSTNAAHQEFLQPWDIPILVIVAYLFWITSAHPCISQLIICASACGSTHARASAYTQERICAS